MKLDIREILDGKVYRMDENIRKCAYIIANSGITLKIISNAARIANGNGYHNFGHQIGVSEYAIRLGKEEGLSPEDINKVAFAGLVHDAGHTGIVRTLDEIRSIRLTEERMDDADFLIFSKDKESGMGIMRELILATIFNKRGESQDQLERIMQDADLAHVGQGIPYWMWASMGLIKEFSDQSKTTISPIEFIKQDQRTFLKFAAKKSKVGSIYVSPGAQLIFRNPLQDLVKLEKMPDEAIQFAYDVRKDNITLAEFKRELKKFKNK